MTIDDIKALIMEVVDDRLRNWLQPSQHTRSLEGGSGYGSVEMDTSYSNDDRITRGSRSIMVNYVAKE